MIIDEHYVGILQFVGKGNIFFRYKYVLMLNNSAKLLKIGKILPRFRVFPYLCSDF